MTVPGGRELRISFRQHDGEMDGRCWCGRTSSSAHPRQLWEWLDEHEHAPSPAPTARPVPAADEPGGRRG